MASSLKKTEVKLELLSDIEMLLMVEKEIRGGIVTQLINMEKLIINIYKIMVGIKGHHILNIGM